MEIVDLVRPEVLTGYVRVLPVPSDQTLNQALPDRVINDIELFIDVVTRINRTAKFRAFDTETPIGRRDSMQRNRVGLPPLGQKLRLGEQERLQLNRLRMGGLSDEAMVEQIYNDTDISVRTVQNRMELERGRCLTTGTVTLNENGLSLEADYQVPGGNFVAAAVNWSDTENATPLTDLLAWRTYYVNLVGVAPGFMRMSNVQVNNLLLNKEVRQSLAVLTGGMGVIPGLVTLPQLQQVLSAYRLPQLIEYDTRLNVDGTDQRVIPDNKVVFTPANPSDLGYTAWGVTAEALSLAGGTNPYLQVTDIPGIVAVVMTDGDPVSTWTKVAAVGMPVITDPRRLMVATVDD